jgi:4-hydroxybenzoate polyprenyltransferase
MSTIQDTGSTEAGGGVRPLCVGLRGGLLTNGLVPEAALSLVKRRPALLLRLPVWRARGRESFRREVAGRIPADPAHLPYDTERLRYLAAVRAAGGTVVLISDEHPEWVRGVAAHLRAFDEVVTAEDGSGDGLARPLEERYGRGGFDLVAAGAGYEPVEALARRVVEVPRQARPSGAVVLVRALRVHQWLKNLLVFLPVIAGQRLTDAGTMISAVLAFVAFSLVASSVYVVNDALDIRDDRTHHSKRTRPFAAGDLGLRRAPLLVVTLLLGATGITILLPPAFAAVLVGYLALTYAYSLKLKGAVLIDVLTLAGLYSVRVLAGSAATGIEPSVWLLGFSLFFFLSLAMVKRYAELHRKVQDGDYLEDGRVPGRGYQPGDLPVLIGLGTGTGCMAVLILALYVISDEFALHYRYAFILWLLCPLMLYWLGRAWIVVSRDEMTDDPVVWAARDQLSRWVAIIAVAILVLAR